MTAPLDIHALRALPMSTAPRRWLTPATLGAQLGIAPDVARSVLVRLRTRGLAEHDTAYPQSARTARGDWVIEQTEHLGQL
jgi:hypothetical protein